MTMTAFDDLAAAIERRHELTSMPLLSVCLEQAVPGRIDMFRTVTENEIHRHASTASKVISSEPLSFQTHANAKVSLATIAEAIAILSFSPGGVRCFGLSWKSDLQAPATTVTDTNPQSTERREDRSRQPEPGTVSSLRAKGWAPVLLDDRQSPSGELTRLYEITETGGSRYRTRGIEFTESLIFDSSAQTLVNTVNCIGVAGKGLALEFKQRYPRMSEAYSRACGAGQLVPGKLLLHKGMTKWVLSFPTKQHWRNPSRMEWIETGLQKFCDTYERMGITSVAFPQLGCRNGGLDWADVRPVMERYLGGLKIPVSIHLHGDVKEAGQTTLQDQATILLERAPLNGLLCSVCLEPQRSVSSGPVCRNGHGDAPGTTPPPPVPD